MWMTLLSFIGGPVVRGLIEAYQAKLKAGNVESKIAADLAAGEIAAQTADIRERELTKRDEIGHPWEVEKLFAYVTLVYYAKLLIWDKVLGLGTTDPLAGFAATAASMILGFYFAKRGFENVARIIRR